jgi:hypothetical protein
MGEDIMDKVHISSLSLINNQRHFFAGNIVKGIRLQKNTETRFNVGINSQFKCALRIDLNEVQ